MLTSLSVKNFALIEALQVNFSSGLSIITGETGAGKSILLGGLSLVLGKRADLSQIKDASKKCVIEAVFDIANYDLKLLFEDQNLDYEPHTILRREILPSGKSRAFVNDTPVTLDSLSKLSLHLLDIHSQHQTLQLVDNKFQFMIIDALADNFKLLNDYKAILSDYKISKQQLQELNVAQSNAKKEYDYNMFLLNELKSANLKKGEFNQLETAYEKLNNVEQIAEALAFSKAQLTNENIGVIEQLNAIIRQFSAIENFGSTYKSIADRITSSKIELEDISQSLYDLEDELVSDPLELERVGSKLEVINHLLHKHSVRDVDDLLLLQQNLESKLSALENLKDDIDQLTKTCNTLEKQLKDHAQRLSASRRKATPVFIKTLESILADLGMPNAKFKIEFIASDTFKSNGMDELHVLFRANKGAQYKQLKQSASGGELSRIMLAIKSILANYIKLPTIIFDEIDTGVSGEISNKMAAIMTTMSKKMQVFVITHLPQVAAKGDRHYKVFKTDKANSTQTQVKELSQDQRIVELAQMLGGTNITDSAIAHAKELLN